MPLSSSVKRVKRLGGWHRIGITASILWLVVGAFWGYKVGDLEGLRTVVYWRFDCIAHNGVTEWDRNGKPINGPPQASSVGVYIDPSTGERLWVSAGASSNPTTFGLRSIAIGGHILHSTRSCRLFWAG
jgi:hypothetical protein